MARTTSDTKSPMALTMLTAVVILAGAIAVGVAAARQALIAEYAWLIMICLALLIAPVSTVPIPGIKADIVLGDIVTFSCAVLFGPSAGVIAAVADGAVTSLRLTKKIEKLLYNVATCAIAMSGAGLITRIVFNQFGVMSPQPAIAYLSGSVVLFTLSYFLISTGLIASYLALSLGRPIVRLWEEKFLWTIVSYLGSGASAILSFSLASRLGHMVFVIVIVLMLMTFLFYRLYFKKVEDRGLAPSLAQSP